MSKKIDLVGQKFNHLTVIKEGDPKKYYNKKTGKYEYKTTWWCKCNCGNEDLILVVGAHLKNGNTKSCGCFRKETARENIEKRKKRNVYDLTGEYGIGYTSNTNEPFYFDLEDYDKIKDYCWYCHKSKGSQYKTLETFTNKKTIRFHYLLDKKGYDHINRNTFDNRKSNLRKASVEENARNHTIRKDNTSGVTGVYWRKDKGKWQAGIGLNGKTKHLGVFDTYEEAVEARIKAEKDLYGEWSPLYKKEESC